MTITADSGIFLFLEHEYDPGVSPDVTPSVPSSPNAFIDSHGVPGAPITSHRVHRLPMHLSIPIVCDDVTGVRDDLVLQKTCATIIGVCDGRRHLRFWDILVRHWCPRRFHCDIFNPWAGLNIYLVITSLLLSHITHGVAGAGWSLPRPMWSRFRFSVMLLIRSWLLTQELNDAGYPFHFTNDFVFPFLTTVSILYTSWFVFCNSGS